MLHLDGLRKLRGSAEVAAGDAATRHIHEATMNTPQLTTRRFVRRKHEL